MRDETFDLAHGVGRIRWSDDRDTVRAQYPRQCIFREPRVTIPRFLRPSKTVSLMAEIRFSDGGLHEIVLQPSLEGRAQKWTAARQEALKRIVDWFGVSLEELGERLDVGDATIVLEEDWDDFTVRLRPRGGA